MIDTEQTLPNEWFNRFEFTKGITSITQLPNDSGAEVAFAGRSNVGKSSVINKITNRKKLARTSKLPGRTQQLNYFTYGDKIHIVDLPGYGYAKVSQNMQQVWAKLLEYYLKERKALRGVFLIMDIRHPMGEFDQRMLNYCQSCKLSLHIMLNKSDKLSRNIATKKMAEVKHKLPDVDGVQLFSVLNGTGMDEAREKLASWLF